MKLKDIKGFMVGALVVASSLSVLAVVQIPNIFKPGDLITADGMNQNFSSLKAGIDALEASVTAKQNKVTGVCAVGSSIREIKADGTVICEASTGTGASYTAGSGLTLAANQFSVDATKVQSRVSGVCAANSAIKEIKPDGQVICEAVGSTGGGVAGVSSVNGKTAGVTLESGSTNLTIDNSQTGKVVFNVASSSYTAGAGLALAGNAFSIDATKTQSRVSGTCAAGSFFTGVNQDGTVNCATPTGGSSYTAGLGLTLTGTQFSADTSAIQARVTGACNAGAALSAIKQDGTVSCNSVVDFAGVLSGTANIASGLTVTNLGDGMGLDVATSSTTGASAIQGISYGATGQTTGVFGRATTSPTGTGVVGIGGVTGGYFQATGEPSGGFTPVGVYGVAQSGQGVGIKAQNNSGGTALEIDGGIKVTGSNPAAFRIVSPAGFYLNGGLIELRNPMTDNNPNALIFLTGIDGFGAYGIQFFYDPSAGLNFWKLGCSVGPTGASVAGARCPKAFNVLIIKQ